MFCYHDDHIYRQEREGLNLMLTQISIVMAHKGEIRFNLSCMRLKKSFNYLWMTRLELVALTRNKHLIFTDPSRTSNLRKLLASSWWDWELAAIAKLHWMGIPFNSSKCFGFNCSNFFFFFWWKVSPGLPFTWSLGLSDVYILFNELY